MRRAVFLDRDGTVVEAIATRPEVDKVTAPWFMKEVRFEPNLEKAMLAFKAKGFLRIMVTNQPDVAYGYLPKDRWGRIFRAILKKVRPDDYYYCPHRREDDCPCKKPKPGMIWQAAYEWDIDLKNSFMIGDTENDIRAGKAAGCKTILIARSYNEAVHAEADFVVPSLLAAATIIRPR